MQLSKSQGNMPIQHILDETFFNLRKAGWHVFLVLQGQLYSLPI